MKQFISPLVILFFITHSVVVGAEPMSAVQKLTDAGAPFAIKLLVALAKKDPRKNLFISPVSIGMALGMVVSGASGTTQSELTNALGLHGWTAQQVNEANGGLLSALMKVDPKITLTIANSIWGNLAQFRAMQADFRPEYLQQAKQFYGAEVKKVDFSAATPRMKLIPGSVPPRRGKSELSSIQGLI